MKKKKNSSFVVIALLLIVTISIGYAALSTTLNINGTSTIKTQTWDVHFANVKVTTNTGATVTKAPTITEGKTTEVTYNVALNQPGSVYEFTVDVVNGGTIAAKTSAIPTLGGNTQPTIFNYTVTWSDGSPITANTALAAGAKKTAKVRIEYKKDITAAQLPTADQALSLTYAMNFVQA